MELKTKENETVCNVISNCTYGCEGKNYYISFYRDRLEKEDRCSCTKSIFGTIENFNPNGQTAIKDKSGDLWLIESKLISIMRPVNDLEYEAKKMQ